MAQLTYARREKIHKTEKWVLRADHVAPESLRASYESRRKNRERKKRNAFLLVTQMLCELAASDAKSCPVLPSSELHVVALINSWHGEKQHLGQQAWTKLHYLPFHLTCFLTRTSCGPHVHSRRKPRSPKPRAIVGTHKVIPAGRPLCQPSYPERPPFSFLIAILHGIIFPACYRCNLSILVALFRTL